jgi:hypothetical protein
MIEKIKFMKSFLIIIILFFPAASFAIPATPTGLSLTAGDTVIKVNWTANTDTILGYYLYWGTSDTNLDMRKTISSPTTTTYTITGLTPNTTYYVAISAFDSSLESAKYSLSTITLKGKSPATPTNFSVTSLSEITGSTVGLKWTENSETDMANYKIYGGTTSGNYSTVLSTSDADVNSYTVTGLNASTRYYFAISSIDSSENESAKSSEIIVDTLSDTTPPNIPQNLIVSITGTDEITATFTDNNTGMVDLWSYKLYYGTASGSYGSPIDIGTSTSYVLSGLSGNVTYFFAVSSYDYNANESSKSTEASIHLEGIKTALDDPDFKGGCFIATAVFGSYNHPAVKVFRKFRDAYLLTNSFGKKFVALYYKYSPDVADMIKESPILKIIFMLILFPLTILCFLVIKIGVPYILLLSVFSILILKYKPIRISLIFLFLFTGISVAQESNTIGIKAGYFLPSSQLQNDIYKKNSAMGTLFYDRRLFQNTSIDIEGGYIEKIGEAITQSGNITKSKTQLILAPISSSLKLNIKFNSFIESSMGGGLDYWYYKETTSKNSYEGMVGGYHGKVGIRLISIPKKDEEYYSASFLIETIYSKIDRFSQNKLDLGGWIFNVGFSYSF